MLDLLIVGCGPVGAVAANLAGAAGLSVAVIERERATFPLPRAIHFDAHVMRILQQAGVAEQLLAETRVWRRSVFYGADSLPIRVHEWPQDAPYGWAAHYLFYQPTLEDVLRANLQRHQQVSLQLGVEVTAITQDHQGVTVTTRGLDTGVWGELRARCLIGADGASSMVRSSIGSTLIDGDFDEPWLVVDLLCSRKLGNPDESEMFCDPTRPATRVPGPGRHHRWEFMLLPGESAEEMQRSETIEELLKPWVRPDEVELIRASVYRFHSLMATSWRDRRVFLAGDAAHQTPPFLGQGLCHGIRDVHNLITKIVAVTAGGPPEELLASYQAERQPHVQQIIDMAVAAGREICLLDPGLAEERDRLMRAAAAAGTLPPTTFQGMPPLSHGLLSQTAGAGEQFPQPVTRLPDGRAGRFDDVIAPDVVVVAYDDGIASLRRATHAMGVPLVALHQAAADSGDLPFVTSTVVDEWFERHGARVAVLRPDRYVYGTAEDIDQAGDLIRNARALFPLP